jgi:hypothetical protein
VGDEGKSRYLLSGVAAATADSARLLMALKPLHNKAKLSRLQIERLQLGFPPLPRPPSTLCLLFGAQERPRRRLNPATLADLIGSAKSRRFRDTVDTMRESQDCIDTYYVFLVSSCTHKRFESRFTGAGW